jgi:hypothetical protein
VKLWARTVREFYLNVDFHVTFRDLLHAVKLRHGTDDFAFPGGGRWNCGRELSGNFA